MLSLLHIFLCICFSQRWAVMLASAICHPDIVTVLAGTTLARFKSVPVLLERVNGLWIEQQINSTPHNPWDVWDHRLKDENKLNYFFTLA